MNTQPQLPMLANILQQPASHRAVLRLQTGSGAAAQAEAAGILNRCSGRILVSGMGASFFALLPFVQALQASGRSAMAVESSDLLYASGKRWLGGDAAVLISRSGASVEVLKLARQMRANGVPTIGVTNLANSPLALLADVTLVLGALPDELIAVQSYTGTVLALLLLASAVTTGSGTRLAAEVETALPSLECLIDASFAASDAWRSVLQEARPLYLLGRGSALCTLHEGSLLLHETAKMPALAMASGQFRHGPVEAVDRDFRAVVVGTDRATTHLDWKLAHDLGRMGARVLWLGPAFSAEPLPRMVDWPDALPEALLPLFDVVPLQVAAYRLAGWRNVIAGSFRYASEITGDESSFPRFEAAVR